MTRGGSVGYTEVPITKIYGYMSNGEFGYSTAMVVMFGMLLLIISFVQLYTSKKLNYNK
jgi:ABC-type sugar transport system permease subunit